VRRPIRCRGWWVDEEIESAFANEQASARAGAASARVLIPIDLDGHLFSDAWTGA